MKILRVVTAIVVAAGLSLLVPVTTARADHRDAPTIDNSPSLNITDVYMFRDPACQTTPCNSPNLVMAMTNEPFANPKAGPSYHFQPNALYRFYFSGTPAAIAAGTPTASIDFEFSPFGNNAACPAPQPQCQTYTATFPGGIVVTGLTTQGSWTAIPKQPVVTQAGPISAFAGPREDPDFFDLVGFERFLTDFNGQTPPAVPHFNLFTGVDAYLGSNVNAIVVDFPISLVLPAGSTKLAAWAVTYTGEVRGNGNSGHEPIQFDQIDRVGNPEINTLFITDPLKDAFNFGLPQDDAADFGATIDSNLIAFGVNQPTVLPALDTAFIPNTLKFDTTLPDGYLQVPPNGRRLGDRTTDFILSLAFNVQGGPGTQHPGSVTCPQLAQTPFSDCTSPKVYLTVFPFLGPPLQQVP